MGELWKHAKQVKTVTSDHIVWSHLYEMFRTGKLVETENILLVHGDGGGWEVGELTVKRNERLSKFDYGDEHTTL